MPEAPETDRAKLREALGLSDPLPTQFVRFVTNAARGDFGQSFFHREPAFKLVTERMPTTLALTCLAVMLALAVALPVGIYSAVRRNTLMDHAATVIVFLGQSMPVFWIGIMLMLLFAVQWRLLSVVLRGPRRSSFPRRARCLLPSPSSPPQSIPPAYS